jgi:hypothetical protein
MMSFQKFLFTWLAKRERSNPVDMIFLQQPSFRCLVARQLRVTDSL